MALSSIGTSSSSLLLFPSSLHRNASVLIKVYPRGTLFPGGHPKPAIGRRRARGIDGVGKPVWFPAWMNILNEQKREQVVALGRLGWPLRRIEAETGVPSGDGERVLEGRGDRRAGGLAGAIGQAIQNRPYRRPPTPAPRRPPRSRGRRGRVAAPQASACEPYRGWIEQTVLRLVEVGLVEEIFLVALVVDLVAEDGLGPAEASRGAEAELPRQVVLAASHDHQILRPADFSNQMVGVLVGPGTRNRTGA